MKTYQMTLDENLIKEVDEYVKIAGISRSEFTRQALRRAIDAIREKELAEKHKAGYEKKPVKKGEFDIWNNEQAWID